MLDTFNHVHICQVSPQLTVKYERDTVQVTSVLISLKNWENNETEKIGLVTPTPGVSDAIRPDRPMPSWSYGCRWPGAK